jgi:NAD(P)-dependent dehydrogenase (short-subunit alcohol dehydrogenase family)
MRDTHTDREDGMAGGFIVTGGSRGIGAAIAKGAGARGWRVCVNYRAGEAQAQAVVQAIRAAGGDAIAVQGDVAVEADVQRLFERVDAAFGTLGVLVNNAGVDHEVAIADMEREHLERVFAVNTFGPYYCAREAIRRMSTVRGGAGGVIVNVSSISAVYGGLPSDVIYAGSKGALDAMTRGLAREVAQEGIRVCGVRPGIIRTEIWNDPQDVVRLGELCVPMGRIGEVEEVATAVLWLCSDEASYVTGTFINVSGGREIHVRSSSE